MRTVNNLLSSLNKLDLLQLMENSMVETGPDYVQIQRQQLSEGIRSDDAFISNLKTGSFEYSPGYAKYKGKSSPIDLRDRGDFYAGIAVEGVQEGLNVFSNDEKSDMLQTTYGKQIFGLSSVNLGQYREILQPVFIQMVENGLNK